MPILSRKTQERPAILENARFEHFLKYHAGRDGPDTRIVAFGKGEGFGNHLAVMSAEGIR